MQPSMLVALILLAAAPLAAGLPDAPGVSVEPDEVLALAGVEHTGAPSVSICGGHAPEVLRCSTPGTHRYVHGFFFPNTMTNTGYQYTGTIESHLTWSGGDRVLRCHLQGQAQPLDCDTSGLAPPPNTPATHRCASFNFRSFVPGGTGTWGCYLMHDI
ncbi:MAG TPA: hypothetical protein VGR28_08235 [Candidatus Thermoplasmatota archaeon]|jgi:hypothetical protein|nr:hypothetical protein [Candidatus Thermoplasmatota archaeon]